MPNWNTQNLGSSILSPAHGLGGAKATILPFSVSVPPSARKKFWPSNQAGKKEGVGGRNSATPEPKRDVSAVLVSRHQSKTIFFSIL